MTTEDVGRELDEFRRLREQVTDARRDALIRRAYAEGMNIRQISKRMGVSRSTVYRVLGLGPVPADGPLDPVTKQLAGMPEEGFKLGGGICANCGNPVPGGGHRDGCRGLVPGSEYVIAVSKPVDEEDGQK